jgi:hypothetical protein
MEADRFQVFALASLQCVLDCDRKLLMTSSRIVQNNQRDEACIFMDDFHRKCAHKMPSGDAFAVDGLDHGRASDLFRKMVLLSEDDASVTLTLISHDDYGNDENTVTFEGTIDDNDVVTWTRCVS